MKITNIIICLLLTFGAIACNNKPDYNVEDDTIENDEASDEKGIEELEEDPEDLADPDITDEN